MRFRMIVLWMLLCWGTSAAAQVSVGVGVAMPGLSIGINLPAYPQLVPVPGYPVYYAPSLRSNYFFYDGMYWVYQGDNWYASSWYNGPWGLVGPQFVPLYVLRVPVRYYRQPPAYFRGWHSNAPPRWGEHWGREWEQHRSGWDRWDRRSVPPPAPLPSYQRKYSGDRYPRVEQQHDLQSQNYRYQPRDPVVREHYRQQGSQRTSAPAQPGAPGAPPERSPSQQDLKHSNSPPPGQQGDGRGQRPPQQQQESAPREQQMRKSQAPDGNPQGKGPQHEKDRDKGDDRGQDHNK